jgi:hypothetical protein
MTQSLDKINRLAPLLELCRRQRTYIHQLDLQPHRQVAGLEGILLPIGPIPRPPNAKRRPPQVVGFGVIRHDVLPSHNTSGPASGEDQQT